MTRIVVRSLPALLLLAAACQSDADIGKPCEKPDQCAEGLICDVHDGKGTCQEPHGHDDAGETAAGTDDHASSDHHHDSDHDHGDTTADTDTTAVTTG